MSETTMKRKTLSIEQSILELKRYLVGKDPTEIENHWEKCIGLLLGREAMHSHAISANRLCFVGYFGEKLRATGA